MATEPSGHRVFDVLRRIDELKISYTLSSVREGSIMFTLALPGDRWEVEVFESGEVEVEIFTSDGTMHEEAALDRLKDHGA